MGNFFRESWLPFIKISTIYRKTAAIARIWHQSWLWRNGNEYDIKFLSATFLPEKRDYKPFRCFVGCLPFTKSFRKIRLESKCNIPAGTFREQRKISKGSAVFPDWTFQTEIRVPFLHQKPSLISVFRPSRSFSVNAGTDLNKWLMRFREEIYQSWILLLKCELTGLHYKR